MSNQKVSLNDNEQKQKLLKIFQNLDHNLEELDSQYKGQSWIEIGFQGTDPCTDFRGTGELGLQNLYYFVTNHKQTANHILKESMLKDQFYFFACCGINITFHILQYFEENQKFFGFEKEKNQEKVLERFNRIYVKIFQNFHKHWLKYEQRSNVMQFNIVMIDYFKNLNFIN